MDEATRFARVALASATATRRPSDANERAIASPTLRPAPVTSATRCSPSSNIFPAPPQCKGIMLVDTLRTSRQLGLTHRGHQRELERHSAVIPHRLRGG